MCIHVSDIYSTHNLGKPNPEYEGQRRKKKCQHRNNYFPEHRNAAFQANWKGRILAGRKGMGTEA